MKITNLVLLVVMVLTCHIGLAQTKKAPSKEVIDAFYEAIFADNNTKVKEMLAGKFPASYEPPNRTTPLQAAIWQKNSTIVKWLVEGGANINSKIKSAVVEAAERGELVILDYLISKGGDIKNNDAFNAATGNNHYECAKLLLLKGANQELGNSSGRIWMLEKAVKNSDYEVLNVLKVSKEEIDANNCEGETALIIAVKDNNPEMVKYLLKLGADKNKPETFDCGDDISYGLKPVQIAKKKKYTEIIKLL